MKKGRKIIGLERHKVFLSTGKRFCKPTLGRFLRFIVVRGFMSMDLAQKSACVP